MYVLSSHIEIGQQLKFDFVTQVKIVSGWKQFTDVAEITIPRNVTVADTGAGIKRGIKNYIKQGDRVLIQLGYDGNLKTEFEGFVSRVKPDIPMVIMCEDYMYHLKRVKVSKSFESVTLNDLVKYLVAEYHKTDRPRIEYEVTATTSIGSIVMEDVSIIKVLQELQVRGFYSFFRSNKLFVGFQSDFGIGTRHNFGFQTNIISNNLEYRLTDDLRFKVKATSHKPDGKKITVEVGDADGDQRTLQYYNLSQAELKKHAEEDLKRMKRGGYLGSFTTFGIPFVQHGDLCHLTDNDYTERTNETYQADTITTAFGMQGFRRTIELGYPVS
ncbi:MAG: hypothetical protein MH137_11125 [Flavobacteriales bacterium]|nr:hypothetical protein [Flavobacteriales bacterium]